MLDVNERIRKLFDKTYSIVEEVMPIWVHQCEIKWRMRVVEQAVYDLRARYQEHRKSAARYLLTDLSHLEDVGVSPDWFRRELHKFEIIPKIRGLRGK